MGSHAGLFVEAGPVGTGVSFVGGDEVGLATHAVARNGVRQVQALHRPGQDAHRGRAAVGVGATVFVAGVQAGAGHAVVLEAQALNGRDPCGGDVHRGHGVVLLQRDVGGLAVFADGDVFRLQVLGRVGTGAVDAHTLRAQFGFTADPGPEVGRGQRGRAAAVDGDDRHGAFGVHRVGLAIAVGLAFQRGQQIAAVGGEGHHVGLRAHGHGVQQAQVGGVVEGDGAGAGLGAGLHGQRHQPVGDGHAVDARAVGRHVDGAHQPRRSGVGQVQHVHRASGAVDDKQPLAARVKRSDLGGAQRGTVVPAQLLQAEGLQQRFAVVPAVAGAERQGGDKGGCHRVQATAGGGVVQKAHGRAIVEVNLTCWRQRMTVP